MANNANIWKLGFFRSMSSMFKGTAREHKCIRVPEEGISQVLSLAMGTGWMSIMDRRIPGPQFIN